MRDAEMQRAEIRRWFSMLAAFERRLQVAPRQMQSPAEAQAAAARMRKVLRWLARACRLAQAEHTPAADDARTLRRQRRAAVLQAWGGQACPVPAFIEAEVRIRDGERGMVYDVAPRSRIADLRVHRRALVDLGIWTLFDRAAAAGLGFRELQADNTRHRWPAAAGLRPAQQRSKGQAQAYADSADAAVLFNVRLRGLLRNLAELYPGAGFDSWLRDDYRPGSSEVEPYARSWTVAAVATYLDWWRGRSDDNVAAACSLACAPAQVRFKLPAALGRPPAGAEPDVPAPAALPTDAPVHAVFVVGLLLAQVLNYRPERWHDTSRRRGFPVPLVLDRLGQADSQRGGEDGRRNVTRYAALTVEPLYGALMVERLQSLAPGGVP